MCHLIVDSHNKIGSKVKRNHIIAIYLIVINCFRFDYETQALRFAILLASVPVPSPDEWGGLSVRKGIRDIKDQCTKTDDTKQQRNGHSHWPHSPRIWLLVLEPEITISTTIYAADVQLLSSGTPNNPRAVKNICRDKPKNNERMEQWKWFENEFK